MTGRTGSSTRRERLDRATGWLLTAAVFGFLLWIVLGGAAHSGDPKSEARSIGNAGTAAARAIARDASNAATVPGYAGTNVPERNIGANALESEGRARLADPDDPGGQAGRSVIEGVTLRPDVPVTAGDPGVARGRAIAADPQAAAHGAGNLASGSVADCGADLQDAQDGGSCGSVRWCVGAGCETVQAQANTGFVEATTLQRAAAFSDAFRRTVWATPELDYTLKRPVGALAKQVWSDGRRQARDAALARLGERYGLIYLGHAGCGGCRVFGPLLRAFATRHGLDVLAVSLTGEALEGWPEAVADRGRAARLGLGNAPVPALVLFDTRTKRVLPVGFGVMAEDEMAERLFALTALEPGHDY
ncbi:MAG: conjugal transfer protein TraF [Defluviicoccus sp.]|nr:conjugal transfer protein TraF [Defluviicoccus sp.]